MKLLLKVVVIVDLIVIEQLEMWLVYQCYWCEYKLFVMINVKVDEWFEVGVFVYKYFDEMFGVLFLFYSEYMYQ